MSRMSQLAMELDEQAWELGFKGAEDAMQHGWRPNYEKQKLEPPVVQPELDTMREQVLAHEKWLEEREMLLKALDETEREAREDNREWDAVIIKETIRFIKEGGR